MSFQITLKPSDHTFTARPDETVLEAALRQGFTLPYGCRNGACGTCKGKILEGRVDYGAYEAALLTDAEKSAGLALFCCAKPLADMVLECREIGAVRNIPIKTLPCRVQRIEKPAHDVVVLYLKLPANERLQFLAGQYVDILLKDGRRRGFSIANAPHDDEFLQLHVREVPGGHFTHYIFHEMQDKAMLRFEGPLGTFFLREDSDKPMILLAGGTGFAPIKAILEHAFHKGTTRPMTLYWGVRSLRDLYMPELARKWQEQYGIFQFVPVLSEPLAEDNWQGRIGFVHRAVADDFADLSGYQVYACGPPAMIDAGRRVFVEKGLPAQELYSDAFTFSNDPKGSSH
ncbi:MAG: CDP-6-deoxy-delta-3,4-glucoseen reductase [Burkholderiales bacterium]